MRLDHLGLLATARTKYIKNSFLATAVLEGIRRFHHALHAYDGAIARYTTYSHFVRDVMVDTGFSPEKISVISPFAEPLMGEKWGVDPVSRDRRGKAQDTSPCILFAGRLEAYKGAHVLIEAAKYLPQGVRIVFAGVGADLERLQVLAKHDSRIEFLGFVPGNELWNLMGQASVVVVPSLWPEVFGLVALEAMCQGTPVIVAKSGGLPEIIGSSAAGIVVPPGDVQALARAIRRMLEDPVLAARMGNAAYVRAREIGNPQEHLAKIMEIYSHCG